MKKFFQQVIELFIGGFERVRNLFEKLDLSITHLVVFFGILGLAILLSIKVLSTKYFSTINSEIAILDQFLSLVDKTMKDPGACTKTLRNAHNNYYPKKLRSIRSANGYVEFQVEQKPTNNFEFSKLSAQMIDKSKNKRSVLMKFTFKHLKTKELYHRYRLILVTMKKNKIYQCKNGPQLRL